MTMTQYDRVYQDVNARIDTLLPLFKRLKSQYKLSDTQAMGLLTNIAAESGGNPNARNGQYFGYTQLSPMQVDFIKKYYGSTNGHAQLRYLTDGMRGKIKTNDNNINYELKMLQKLNKNYTDSLSFARDFHKYHERSGNQDWPKRQLYNKALREIFKNKFHINVASNLFNPNIDLYNQNIDLNEQNYLT